MYVRKETSDCWQVFEKACAQKTNVALSGPPGTGKSITAWACARWQAFYHKQVVLWYHYDIMKRAIGVKLVLRGGFISQLESKARLEIDPRVDIDRDVTIVIVDGVTRKNTTPVSHACTSWRAASRGMFILISSEEYDDVPVQDNQNSAIECYRVPSWSLTDYTQACANETFYASVQAALVSPSPERAKFLVEESDPPAKKKKAKYSTDEKELSKEALLNNKYYYAGGSARWMFQFSYVAWKEDVEKHLRRIEHYGDYAKGAVNHLRGMNMVDAEPVYSFTSEYVGVQLARLAAKEGSQRQFIFDGYDVANRLANLAFRRRIFEFDVDYQLRRAADAAQGGLLKSLIRVWVNHSPETWEVTEYVTFHTRKFLANKVAALTDKQHFWAKPASWRQAAFDFLHFSCVGTDIYLRVLNATPASQHNLFLDEIKALLLKLAKHSPDPEDTKLPTPPRVTRVRFEFVIPHGNEKQFTISSTRGDLVMWKNFRGDPWTPNIRDLSPHFVVVTELDHLPGLHCR